MTSAYAQLQRMGRLLLRAQGFRLREERTAAGRRFFLYERDGRGSGPPILLVHGLGGAATSFASIASKCARLSRRVLLIDLPGHGLAALGEGEKPAGALELTQALARVLELASEPVLLVGNSLGGGLVLGARSCGRRRSRGRWGWRPRGRRSPRRSRCKCGRCSAAAPRAGASWGGGSSTRRPSRCGWWHAGWARSIAEPAVQHIVGHIHKGESSLPQEQLQALRVPVLVLWGDADQVLPASGANYFRAALPAGSVEVLEQCGHLPQIERAGLVLARLERFIAALPRRPDTA